ncbi:hypothetical protein BDQ12DRAFT_135041 [Crucibulum laeve]|uniref:Uncharacterized protein n=1 Tax=Crucibulum laeve TaxID=68775 RepID=A0A5C3LYK3_9AGAR|nr:hypothetical protein BDQ12DRAFT_135041 [Crucibulum laeve]
MIRLDSQIRRKSVLLTAFSNPFFSLPCIASFSVIPKWLETSLRVLLRRETRLGRGSLFQLVS